MDTITTENLYNYFVIEEWDDKRNDGTDGFSYFQSYDEIGDNDEDAGFQELHDKMLNEILLNCDNFKAERSCMWVDEVKRRAKWVRGETLYGDSREKNYTYPIWWSRDKTKIGHSTWILEADGYVSFSNGYPRDEKKRGNYIRPPCLYNDKNRDELKALKIEPKIGPKIIKKKLIIEEDSDDENAELKKKK